MTAQSSKSGRRRGRPRKDQSPHGAIPAAESTPEPRRTVEEAERRLMMTDQGKYRARKRSVNLDAINVEGLPEKIAHMVETYGRDEWQPEVLWEVIDLLFAQMGAILSEDTQIADDEALSSVDPRVVRARMTAGIALVTSYMKLHEAHRQRETYRKVFGESASSGGNGSEAYT